MKCMTKYVVAALASLLATSTAAAQIVRHKEAGALPILQAVTIPPGAETLMLSGQVPSPIDPAKPASTLEAYGDTRTQTISTLRKIEAILRARGYAMSDVIRMTVFLVADPRRGEGRMDFAGMNEGFRQFFGTAANPSTVARSTVQVAGLASPHYLVEIEVTAAKVR
jgi:enamine deaminase RidA (YjgF/YER057c/UK114 family)